MIKINTIRFEDIKSLSNNIDKNVKALDDCEQISIIAKYDEAKEIIRNLVLIGHDIASLEIHKEEFDDYWDEYIIGILKIDGICEIWCEKFKRNNEYLNDESSITYVFDNCNSKCIHKITSPIQYEIAVEYEDFKTVCKNVTTKFGNDQMIQMMLQDLQP